MAEAAGRSGYDAVVATQAGRYARWFLDHPRYDWPPIAAYTVAHYPLDVPRAPAGFERATRFVGVPGRSTRIPVGRAGAATAQAIAAAVDRLHRGLPAYLATADGALALATITGAGVGIEGVLDPEEAMHATIDLVAALVAQICAPMKRAGRERTIASAQKIPVADAHGLWVAVEVTGLAINGWVTPLMTLLAAPQERCQRGEVMLPATRAGVEATAKAMPRTALLPIGVGDQTGIDHIAGVISNGMCDSLILRTHPRPADWCLES